MQAKFRKPLRDIIKEKIEPYDLEVGVFSSEPHRAAVPKSKKSFFGGPARRTGRQVDGTMAAVSRSARRALGHNYLTKPFRARRSSEALKLLQGFFKMCFAKESRGAHKKRVENLLQAVVRNPILQGKYGKNRSLTKKIKGFSRPFIDTGQLFRNIKGRVIIKR